MLISSAEYDYSRVAYAIQFGLSDHDISELQKSCIIINESCLNLPPPGCSFIIMTAGDNIEKSMNSILSDITCDNNIAVVHVDDSFYVSVVGRPDDSILYVIALNNASYHALTKRPLTFRSRAILGNAVPVEVTIFWGRTDPEMKQEYQKYKHKCNDN